MTMISITKFFTFDFMTKPLAQARWRKAKVLVP